MPQASVVYHQGMGFPHDVASIRLDNALRLFDEFVQATVKHPDAATLRGLERRFAERMLIQPSYWSQIKSRSRQIGEKLARQFERLAHKPPGWMDQPPGGAVLPLPRTPDDAPTQDDTLPRDDDERFIVGLVLSYYRRHPQRARTRLLDLLGEVLAPAAATPAMQPPRPADAPEPTADEALALWRQAQKGVAPLKKGR
jgi:hypothetical protein